MQEKRKANHLGMREYNKILYSRYHSWINTETFEIGMTVTGLKRSPLAFFVDDWYVDIQSIVEIDSIIKKTCSLRNVPGLTGSFDDRFTGFVQVVLVSPICGVLTRHNHSWGKEHTSVGDLSRQWMVSIQPTDSLRGLDHLMDYQEYMSYCLD